MPLSPLSLNITTGVVGRPFSATIAGQSSGSTIEVVGYDGTPGFSTVNGRVFHSGLPYQVNTVVLRETLAGEGVRDSRIDIVADGIELGVAGLPAALDAIPGYSTARQLGLSTKGDAILAPMANVTFAANGAGALTGAYFYHVTYVTALGETAPWVGQATPVTLASQQMLVTLPAAPDGVIARRLYRSLAGGAASDRAVFFRAEVAGNAATTFADNAADNTLGSAPSWSSSNRGYLSDGITAIPFARFSDQVTTFGGQAGGSVPSYATTAFGFRAGASLNGATRNTFMGVYAGELTTTGRENTGVGVHALNACVDGTGNTALGYQAGGTFRPIGNYNTAIGSGALGGIAGDTTPTGTFNVALGFQALQRIATAISRVIGLGTYAGKYADAASQLYIDNQDRGDAATSKTASLIYGVGNATMQAQTLALNAATRVGGLVTVAQLPAASAALRGHRFVVTDGSAAYTSANVGATVAGGGANTAPVFCNGTAWVIG